MTYEDNKFKAGGGTLALGIIGTAGAALALSQNNCGNHGGNGLLGGLLGGNNNCMWTDREVSLQRQIDALAAQELVTANVTPYQIREATCDMVRAQKFIPSREIVYTANGGRCGSNYDSGCDCYGI